MAQTAQARKQVTVRWLVAVALLLVAAHPAAAQDLATGQKAFLEGRYETAISILRPLAEAGEAEAQYLVGVMYAHGSGYEPVCRQAVRWYEKAAEQGHPEANFNLGFLFYNGSGLADDVCLLRASPERAAPWLKRAAEMGMRRAQWIVGHMYATGEGLPVSVDRAFYWTGKAAENGSSTAQYDLALLYAQAGNRVDAHAWFTILAEKGYPGARINMGRLAANMTGDQLGLAWMHARSLRSAE